MILLASEDYISPGLKGSNQITAQLCTLLAGAPIYRRTNLGLARSAEHTMTSLALGQVYRPQRDWTVHPTSESPRGHNSPNSYRDLPQGPFQGIVKSSGLPSRQPYSGTGWNQRCYVPLELMVQSKSPRPLIELPTLVGPFWYFDAGC